MVNSFDPSIFPPLQLAPPGAVWWPINPQQQAALESRAEILLYGGGSGGGKSDFLVADAMQEHENPNLRGLLLRKSYGEMNQLMDRMEAVYKPYGASFNSRDHVWVFPSGAKIRTGYLACDKDVGKYRGNTVSWLGLDEAGEQPEHRIRKLIPWLASTDPKLRIRLRMTANPGGEGMAWLPRMFLRSKCPVHFPCEANEANREEASTYPGRIYQGARWRSDDGLVAKTTAFIPALAKDNPLYDQKKIDSLLSQTLEVQEHLLHGCWCKSEGMYFEFWRKNLIVPYHELNEQWWWNHFISIDYGYGNSSAAAGLYVINETGKIAKIAERIRSRMSSAQFMNMLVEDWIKQPLSFPEDMLKQDGNLNPKAAQRLQRWLESRPDGQPTPERRKIVCCFIDPANDAHDGTGQSNKEIMAEYLVPYGIPMLNAAKDRAGNAQQLHRKLRTQQVVLCDTVPEACDSISSRICDDKLTGAVKKIPGDPLDDSYDECLIEGTLIATPAGPCNIESLKRGDMVYTSEGPRKLLWAGMTNEEAELIVTEFSNGTSLTGTKNHPIFIAPDGFKSVDKLVYGDNVLTWQEWKKLYSTESSTGDTPTRSNHHTVSTSFPAWLINFKASKACIGISGSISRVLYRKGTKYITKTKTHPTIRSTITNVSRSPSISAGIATQDGKTARPILGTWKEYVSSRSLGMVLKRVWHLIAQSQRIGGLPTLPRPLFALFAEKLRRFVGRTPPAYVPERVQRRAGGTLGSITSTSNAPSVARCSTLVDSMQDNTAPVHVLRQRTGGRGRVYNLTVEGVPEYFANGILVHNCSYGINTWPTVTVKPQQVAIEEKIAAMANQGVDDRSLLIHRTRLEREKKPMNQPIPLGRPRINQRPASATGANRGMPLKRGR